MFCCKKKREPKKYTQTILYKEENYKVGKTNIRLKLKDGRKFIKIVEGTLYQHVEHGQDEYISILNMREPIVSNVQIFSSLNNARAAINNFAPNEQKITLNPDQIIFGQVIEAKILDTDENHEKLCQVAYLVPRT